MNQENFSFAIKSAAAAAAKQPRVCSRPLLFQIRERDIFGGRVRKCIPGEHECVCLKTVKESPPSLGLRSSWEK